MNKIIQQEEFHKVGNFTQSYGNSHNESDILHCKLIQILFEQFEKRFPDANTDINSIADTMKVSRRWLYEQTLRLTGKTPSEYLKHLRMHAACPLLQKRKSLVEVSKAVGYSHTKTFSEAFKKHFGMPPGMWAKENSLPTTIAPTSSDSS
ncbi:MAG: helix-turn-helix transcriptional regulator [Ignavibacteria bacterium]|nr:helix-turn-helix transcriptional regulator [Ignavibacteria bacterium]